VLVGPIYHTEKTYDTVAPPGSTGSTVRTVFRSTVALLDEPSFSDERFPISE